MARLIDLDKAIFGLLNGLGSPVLDPIMLGLSHKWLWIPLYGFIVYKLYRQYGQAIWIPLLGIALLITFTDQMTSSFMKPFFERLRPCHDPDLIDTAITYGKCGGQFGFASSHAANTMGLASFLVITFHKSRLSILILFWALAVGYSRIYLGVHFPLDVLAGFGVGATGGIALAYLTRTASSLIGSPGQ